LSEKPIGITVKKKENFSEWFTQVLIKADLIDQRYNVQGFIVHKPWAMRIIKQIYKLFEEELEKTGHEPVLFPLVIPEENFEKEKEHVEGFKPEVFWVTEAGEEKLERRLALRPTSETAFYQMYSLWINSWRDLPLKLYQSVSVYRYEKNTRPFIRGREFLWIEAHNAFKNHDEVLKQIREDMENTTKIVWEQLAIPFLFLRRPKWDKFAGAVDTYAADTLMPDGRVLQISSTHDLGQNFSKAFEVTYVDKEGERHYVWQTCYGPGIWRIVAALISIHGDDKGLVLPFSVAPIQVIIIPIYYDESEKQVVMKKCEEIYEFLRKKKIRVKIDTREKTPGWKFNDWELKGVPIRIEIGKKEVQQGYITIYRRDLRKRQKVDADLEKIYSFIIKLAEDMLETLKKKSKEYFESHIVFAKNKNEIMDALKRRCLIKMPFCGEEGCAMDMKEKTDGLKVRGTSIDGEDKVENLKCAWCNKPAKKIVYVAKAY